MGNDTTRCPRCDDYDEVVEELKNEKELRDRESKDALRKCEEGHKKKDGQIKGLEKKILTITIVAAVAGTVVGKEFIDKIASYIESFNSVKNAASGLVSTADITDSPPDQNQNSDSDSEKDSKDNEEEQNRPTTRRVYAALPTGNSPGWQSVASGRYSLGALSDFYNSSGNSLVDDLLLGQTQNENILLDYMKMFADIPIDDFSFAFETPPDYYLEPNFMFDSYAGQQETSAVMVPELSPLIAFAFGVPIVFAPRRRRK
tara:strand:- start:476 stop:1252 length:777 start_codon:yes stop_codon:yes gene_type:complete